jgi:DNA-binding NarL/FixJ family response regulator
MRSSLDSVALVVDEPAVAQRLRRALTGGTFDCTIEVKSVDELPSHHAVTSIDVLVLRLGSRRDEILETFKRACALLPNTPIVGVWPDGLRREDRRALMTGVDGLLQEDQIESALASTVQAVRSGLICLPQRTPNGAHAPTLSSREKQVLSMLIMGFTNAEIGRRLYLAESTVKSHLSSAYTKLGVRSRKDAAALILDPNGGLGTGILAISAA